MSKETILEKNGCKDEFYPTNPPRNTGMVLIKKDKLIASMDEYAKEVAVEFRKWNKERNKKLLLDEACQWHRNNETTDEELFNQFIQSKTP